MYKAIVMLLIPIVFNVVIGMCKHTAAINTTSIKEHGLVVTYKDRQTYVQSKGTRIAVLHYETNKAQ
jgi:hypothetical protein